MTIMKTHGLIAAPYTGVNGNGEINLRIVPQYAAHLMKMGVKGAFVAGTTGEGMFLGDGERLKLIEAWADQKKEGFRIIAHVGSTSLANAVVMAKESAQLGADAIAI